VHRPHPILLDLSFERHLQHFEVFLRFEEILETLVVVRLDLLELLESVKRWLSLALHQLLVEHLGELQFEKSGVVDGQAEDHPHELEHYRRLEGLRVEPVQPPVALRHEQVAIGIEDLLDEELEVLLLDSTPIIPHLAEEGHPERVLEAAFRPRKPLDGVVEDGRAIDLQQEV